MGAEKITLFESLSPSEKIKKLDKLEKLENLEKIELEKIRQQGLYTPFYLPYKVPFFENPEDIKSNFEPVSTKSRRLKRGLSNISTEGSPKKSIQNEPINSNSIYPQPIQS